MGWGFHKSVGDKYFHANIGQSRIRSFTLGSRGMPHLNIGKHGVTVGAPVPGTGVRYTSKLGNTDNQVKASELNASFQDAPTLTIPAQAQASTAALPPHGNGAPQRGSSNHGARLPMSKTIVTSVILGVIGILCSFFKSYAPLSVFLSFFAVLLAIIGLLLVNFRKKTRGTFAGVAALCIAVFAFTAGAVNMPASTTHASAQPTNSTSSSAPKLSKAQQAAKAKKEKAAKQAAIILSASKQSLSEKITEARNLLDSSANHVADDQTRSQLSDAIATASDLVSSTPNDYAQASSSLQSAMDTVNESISEKHTNDAVASQQAKDAQASQAAQASQSAASASASASASAKARADQQASAQAQRTEQASQQATQQHSTATQTQQSQQASSGSLIAVCKDNTQSQSAPGAPNYRGMCSHHGGIKERLGRR